MPALGVFFRMGCGACGFTNADGSRFCGQCGTALEVVCSGCAAAVTPGLKFCNQCGAPVGATGSAPAAGTDPPALIAQRKNITVVFGDVGGSTGLGERLDPEAARAVMNRYHLDVLEVIGAYGGTVDKFNGDGFMATFGIPEVSEDDATRAVEAAVQIQERFTPFAAAVQERHGGEAITLRIGVNTGEIVIAEGDPDIIGDALNVAARLERACPSGGVLVGPETWRLTRNAWSYEAQGEVTVAGRVEPVEVFLVDKASAEVETATPFVGRERELDILTSQRQQSIEGHSLRLVNVIGSPGLGKSRLAREVAAGLDFDHRHTVSCERAGASTYAPVIDLVRSVADVGPTVSPEAIMDGLRDRFAHVDFDDREADRLRDAMSGLVGAGPIRSTEESFWAVRRMVELVGREGPTLIVVDDIQWAEPVVLDLLEHLAEWVTGADVVLLCLARPEIRELRPSFAEAGRRAAAVISLEGLDAAATATLAQRMLGEGELPAALIERIPTSTEGNPLFVRELVKMLVDDGVVVRGPSGWELTIDAEAVEVPPTIASLLAARIDRLPDAERMVLERAAVIGPEFVEGALRAIAGEHAGGLSSVLERLRRMELVEPTGSYWGDHAVHRFHHVLIRDAAYRRLLKGARADLHEQVGGWLEAAAEDLPGDHDEVVAFHEEQAFRYRSELGPLDEHSVEVGRRASARLARAASRALARDDLTAAGPLALRALDCVPSTDQTRGELLLVACEALLGTGDVVRGEAAVGELDALAPDDRLRAWAACFRAQLTAMTEPDRLPEAEREATSAADILEALRDDAGAAKGHLTRARILVLLGRVGEAETELDRALTAAREADDARRITAVLGNAPLAALWGPSPVPRAGGRCLDIVRLLRITTRAPAVEATSMRCQALLEALRGRFDTARTMIERCRRKVDELGLRLGSLETDLFAGQIEMLAGDLDAAERALRRASTGLATMRLGAEAGQATSLLARVLVAKGEVGEAEVLVGTAEQMAGRNLKSAVAWRLARAEVLLAQGHASQAVAVALAAVEVVAETDLVVDQADAELVLAQALRADGDEVGAATADARARALADAKGASVLVDSTPPSEAVQPASPVIESLSIQPAVVHETGGIEPWRPHDTTVMRMFRRMEQAIDDGDAEALSRCVHPDLVWHDHRHLFAGTFDADAWTESMAPVEHGHAELIACATDLVALVVARFRTHGYESEMLQVVRADTGGRMVLAHSFDPDDVDTAIERFRVETSESAEANDESWFSNRASDVSQTINVLINLGAIEATKRLLAPDTESIEHRADSMGLATLVGPDQVLDMYRTVAELGVRVAFRTLRVEGDRLALGTYWFDDVENGYQFDVVQVNELDSEGRVAATVMFDLDQWDAAIAEFDRRGAVLDGRAPKIEPWDPKSTWIYRTIMAGAEDVESGDFDRHRRRYADDFVYTDHRPGLLGTFNADQQVDSFRGGDRVDVRIVLLPTDRVGLFLFDAETQGFSIMFLSVAHVGPDGLMRSFDTFEVEQLDAAIDRFHEVLADDAERFGGDVVANDAARLVDRISARLVLGDLDAIGDLLDDDMTHEERRQGALGLASFRGRESVLEALRTLGRPDVMAARPVRTAGDRCALLVVHLHVGGFPFDLAYVFATDGERALSSTTWDLAEWDAAAAELERLSAAGATTIEPWDPEATTAMQYFRLLQRLTNDGEHHRHPSIYPDHLVWVDHRPIVGGTFGADEMFESLYPVQRTVARPILVTVDRVALARATMTTKDFEVEYLQLGWTDRDGSAIQQHTLDLDQIDVAVDTYHRLVIEDAERFGGDLATNAASRLLDRAFAVLGMGRVDHALELASPDFVQVDHRAGFVGHRIEGPADFGKNLEAMFDGRSSMFGPTIRTAGDRLALQKVRWRGHDYHVDILAMVECDEAGRDRAHDLYDLDQYDEAAAEFERRAIAISGAAHGVEPWDPLDTVACRTLLALCDAINAGDVDAMRALYHDDFVNIDRRPGLRSENDRDAIVALQQSVESVEWEFVLVGAERVSVGRILHHNRDFEIDMMVVAHCSPDGRIHSVWSFDPDDVDGALDRYHEMLVEDAERYGGEALVNDATRSAARLDAHGNLDAYDEAVAMLERRATEIDPSVAERSTTGSD